jgi:hypothetical protein
MATLDTIDHHLLVHTNKKKDLLQFTIQYLQFFIFLQFLICF